MNKDLESGIENLKAEITEKENSLLDSKATGEEARVELTNANDLNSKLKSQIEKMEADLAALHNEHDELRETHTKLVEEHQLTSS